MEVQVRLRVICHGPPPPQRNGEPAEFGLQDAGGNLHPGEAQPDGSVAFTCTVRARPDAGTGRPRFLGPFVHGPAAGRFLYLSYRRKGGGTDWIGRIKVVLSPITWEQAAAAGVLEAAVSGTRPDGCPAWATVPLIGGGWALLEA